jgi:acid phosphatase class B
MNVDKSKMGLIFKHERVSVTHQEISLREAGASWIVPVGRVCPSWMEAAKQVRNGDVIFIYAGVMVPHRRQKGDMSRPAQFASFMTEVHERGGHVVEVLTGRNSAKLAQQRDMIEETIRLLKQSGNRLPAAGRKPGRQPNEWPSVEVRNQAFAIWTNKDFPSDAAALRNAPKGVTERMMRNFGPSGRQK